MPKRPLKGPLSPLNRHGRPRTVLRGAARAEWIERLATAQRRRAAMIELTDRVAAELSSAETPTIQDLADMLAGIADGLK